MKRRSKTGRKPGKARQHKAEALKRDNAPKPVRSSAGGQESEAARFKRERDEALARETATAEILASISGSMTDAKPVFDAIVRTVSRLFGTRFAIITLLRGDVIEIAAFVGDPGFEKFAARFPVPLNEHSLAGKTILAGRAIILAPIIGNPDAPPLAAQSAREFGFNSQLSAPIFRAGRAIGAIVTAHRDEAAFNDKKLALIKSFADQAIIAIENAQMFNELRESLEQQTAASEVLNVISSSPGELQPVFRTILENASRLCEANFGILNLYDSGNLPVVAMHNVPEAFAQWRRQENLVRPGSTHVLARVATTKRLLHVTDMKAEPAYITKEPPFVALVDGGGARTLLIVPMLKNNQLLGTVSIYRQEVRPFTEKQIALLANFAAQAVIAIENARLLSELRQSLDQQTATADVLRVISSSPGDLEPVFQAMLENATRICDAKFGNLLLHDGNVFHVRAMHNAPPAWNEMRRRDPSFHPGVKHPLARMAVTKELQHITDLKTDVSYLERDPTLIPIVDLAGARTALVVPMLKENDLIGAIVIYRQEVRPFNDKQIALVQNFAAQAVIAIENTRLLNELRQRTNDLTKSLEDLRTAQDRLVQTEKLASLGQLTAGIAHEIKNPLNFVNNFSSVSMELIDELREALGGMHLDSKQHAEIAEIADTLQGNLDKIVQHGKRADAIVKNMLLHSRQGSGEHRPVEINALVEESLNLAYHGARAEKQGFNITLERSFDPATGEVDLFPQEITRVLLNLISNSFYAATKRKAETNGGDYEPTLTAVTKNLGDSVEIRIRDNGTGIPDEVKEKMFNPFFTTKPAGEGTGLGLSISHDIIVKQHGGTIEVDTKPGEFTEFRIVLPRMGMAVNKAGERA
jgi:two-component system, NtrC family, sensor kinase